MQETQPKYALVYQRLRDKLTEGRFPVGSRLPTEEQMSSEFEVSRITIRRALEQLVSEGYVNRRQGSGYSVIALSPPQQNCLSSFTDMVFRSGATPTSRLLSIREIVPANPLTFPLPRDLVDHGPLLQIRRLRCIDDKPAMLVSTWLAKSEIGDVRPEDFPETGTGQSILRILQEKFSLTWDAACEEISPIAADSEAAQLLAIDVGMPILKQACIAFGKNGKTVFYEDLLRAGTIVFESFALRRQAPESIMKRPLND
ncbi:MAG: GntR family transcriptional regulator [Devosia sp.]|nr:GntR family transcriptional regulator [Devosia sp.]